MNNDIINFMKFVQLDSYDIDYHYTMGEFHFVHKLKILKRAFFHVENLVDKEVFLFH